MKVSDLLVVCKVHEADDDIATGSWWRGQGQPITEIIEHSLVLLGQKRTGPVLFIGDAQTWVLCKQELGARLIVEDFQGYQAITFMGNLTANKAYVIGDYDGPPGGFYVVTLPNGAWLGRVRL